MSTAVQADEELVNLEEESVEQESEVPSESIPVSKDTTPNAPTSSDQGLRIYVGNFPLNATQDDLLDLFRNYETSSCEMKGRYAFLNFKDEASASLAIKEMHEVDFKGAKLIVAPAKPMRRDRDNNRNGMRSPNASLFVRNIPADTSSESLRQAFEAFGPVSRVNILPKHRNHDLLSGFVDFEKKEDALRVHEKETIKINGEPLITDYANNKPARRRDDYRRDDYRRDDYRRGPPPRRGYGGYRDRDRNYPPRGRRDDRRGPPRRDFDDRYRRDDRRDYRDERKGSSDYDRRDRRGSFDRRERGRRDSFDRHDRRFDDRRRNSVDDRDNRRDYRGRRDSRDSYRVRSRSRSPPRRSRSRSPPRRSRSPLR